MARKIRVFIETSMTGSRIESDEDCPDNWDEMSEEEQELYLAQVAENHLQNCADYAAYIVEDGDDNE